MRHADWKDLVMIKLCACAAGVMWGLALPKKLHKAAAFTDGTVYRHISAGDHEIF